MWKHTILILVLCILVVLFSAEVTAILSYYHDFYRLISKLLGKFLLNNRIGWTIIHSAALFLVAFTTALVPTAIYYGFTRKIWSYYPAVLWLSFFLLLGMFGAR